ncbi:MAG: TVP38/TMEM64 family protein [Chloroflexaceae bacterium]
MREQTHRSTLGRKGVVLLFWILLIGAYEWYIVQRDLSHLEALQMFLGWLRTPAGLLVLLLIFALRFLVFFPISLLVVLTGAGFGRLPGIPFAFAGVLLSGSTTYLLARWLGEEGVRRIAAYPIGSRWIGRLRSRGFETVLVLHLLFLPFDLVSALAGWVRVRYRGFASATLLGWIPGSIVFTTIGKSLGQKVTEEGMLAPIEPWMLVLIGVVLVGSLLGAQIYRRYMD